MGMQQVRFAVSSTVVVLFTGLPALAAEHRCGTDVVPAGVLAQETPLATPSAAGQSGAPVASARWNGAIEKAPLRLGADAPRPPLAPRNNTGVAAAWAGSSYAFNGRLEASGMPFQVSLADILKHSLGNLSPRQSIRTSTIVTAANALPAGSNGKQIASGLSGDVLCEMEVTQDYQAHESDYPYPDLLAQFGSAAEVLRQRPDLVEVVNTAKALVDNCYRTMSLSDLDNAGTFSGQHHLSARLGVLLQGKAPVCTALLVGNGARILTARHCFTEKTDTQLADLWFEPANGSGRQQVCSIEEPNALSDDFTTIASDQVVARIAQGLTAPEPISLLPPAKLRDLTAATKATPDITLLVTYSFVPAAKLLYPASTGFVQGKANVCAANTRQAGCFTDLCRSVQGGSGSPIFDGTSTGDAKLTLVGTHVAAGSTSDCRQVIGDSNVAAYPRPSLSNELNVARNGLSGGNP